MPGMMDTVLNLGLNDASVVTLAATSGDERFAYDSYRRFIQMYSNVVLRHRAPHFEEILEVHKEDKGYMLDTDLGAEDWARDHRRLQGQGARGERQAFSAGRPRAALGRGRRGLFPPG